jgi:predicted TIM-barrel fold metal-dependent hydrolase
LKVHRALGLDRAVIVTGSGNGTNNQITLDALQRMKGSFKGLALLDPAISDTALLNLKEAGFTGFRIKANGRGGLSFEETKRMVARTAGFGWHIEFMSQSMGEVIAAVPFLTSLAVPYVFDHVAHAEPQNRDDHEFKELLAILKSEEHAWINLYSFYQLSEAGPPTYFDMVDVIQASSQPAQTTSCGAAIGPMAACDYPCLMMGICSISSWQQRHTQEFASKFSRTIQLSSTAGLCPIDGTGKNGSCDLNIS